MAGTGVHVTALCPTWVKTNIAAQGRISGPSAAMAQRMMARIGFTPALYTAGAGLLNRLAGNRL